VVEPHPLLLFQPKSKPLLRPEGLVWLFCYYVTKVDANGVERRVENSKRIGKPGEIGNEDEAWTAVEKQGLDAYLRNPVPTKPTFRELARHYEVHGMERKGLGRKKASGTVANERRLINNYLVPTWGKRTAQNIEPDEIESWFVHLNEEIGLAWGTIVKIKQTMGVIYHEAQRLKLIPRGNDANPFEFVRVEHESEYVARIVTPEQTVKILTLLEDPERTLTYLIAVTGLRIGEALGLRWSDVDYAKQCIQVERSWRASRLGHCKTKASRAPVPMAPTLAARMKTWQADTPFASADDWVFASAKKHGKVPRNGSMIVADHLRPAAVSAGVISEGEAIRFGFHNLRHSLATKLVGDNVDPKTVQTTLRHANVSTTLGLYAQGIPANRLAAKKHTQRSWKR
jgi:integrase